MGYEAKVNDEPSQLLLENGLVVSFCVRYDHRKVVTVHLSLIAYLQKVTKHTESEY